MTPDQKQKAIDQLKAAIATLEEAEPKSTCDWGEPWEARPAECTKCGYKEGTFYRNRHNETQYSKELSAKMDARAVACVNALAGIPDPAAYVARMKKLNAHCRRIPCEIALTQTHGSDEYQWIKILESLVADV
jgi:hypothetical protein